MFSEINERLIRLKGELRKVTKYQVQLADYVHELGMIEEEISRLKNRFDSEQNDVTKLEGISLLNLFATLAGTKEAKLSKEKQELLAAQHKLTEAIKTKEEIDKEIVLLRDKLRDLESAEHDYQQLLLEKERMVKESTSPLAGKVLALIEQEGNLSAHLSELKEAMDAGSLAKRALANALESLQSAAGWGQWDLFGGGTISGIMKHQHLDEAEKILRLAQTSMRRFQKELLDVKEHADLELNISDMLKFADFFFDGLIVDYLVQDKINRTVSQTENHYEKVKSILVKLNENYMDHKKQLEAVQNEKKEIIESL